MKTIPTALNTHIQSETTSLATCWKLRRRDGLIFTFTEADVEIVVDIGDGDGQQVYTPLFSFNKSAISNTDDLAVDNLEMVGALDATEIDEDELRIGLFDNAVIWIFMASKSYGRAWHGGLRTATPILAVSPSTVCSQYPLSARKLNARDRLGRRSGPR